MRLGAIDLNLLVPLEALLRLRNVTQAAAEVGISQPAMSSALRRLRRQFSDELMERVGNSYQLTPLALRLVDDLDLTLELASRTLNAQPTFDPATADRSFTVVCSDYALWILGEALVLRLQENAPSVRLNFEMLAPVALDDMDKLLSSRDLLLFPRGFASGYRSEDLFTDRWVCLVSKSNELFGSHLTMDDIDRVGWVVMYHRKTAYTLADRALDAVAPHRRVEIIVETFVDVPLVVAASKRVGLIQQRLAERFAPIAPTRMLACPVEVGPLQETLWWHPRHDRDPGHTWLRRQFVEVARELAPVGPLVDAPATTADAKPLSP